MKLRQLVVPVVVVLAFLALGFAALQMPGLYPALYVALVVAIGVGFAVRIARSRHHPIRVGLAPAGDAGELVQDLYLARPRVPVVYGDGNPDPDLTLVVDAPDQDPGDLCDLPAERSS